MAKYKTFITSGDYKNKDKVIKQITSFLEGHCWSAELVPCLGSKLGNSTLAHWYWGVQIKPYSDIKLGYFSFKKLVHFVQENLRSYKSNLYFQFLQEYKVTKGWSETGVGYMVSESLELGGESDKGQTVQLIDEETLHDIYERYVSGTAVIFS